MSVNIGSAEGYIDLNTSGFDAGIKATMGKLEAFQSRAEGMGKNLQNIGSSLSSIGTKLSIGVTAPLAVLGKSIMETTATFEAKMSSVKATLGAGTDDMKQLHDEAIKLGADTAFSASEAAEGMENLASAGFNTNEIMKAMPGMLSLAAAGDLSIADASDIASSSLRGFGLQASDSAHVADVFAKVAADTNAQVQDLGEAMKYAAPVAHGFGLNIEETSAAIGEMANAGIKGSQAGTTLRASLTSLANPSKEAADTMKQIGFNAFDAHGKMLPLPQLIGNLQKSMSGLTQQQKEHDLSVIFGTEALSGMQVLVEQGPEALKKEEDALKSCAGAAQQMGDTKMDNLKGSVEQMKGSFETLGISMGEIVTPALRKFVDSITDTVNSINNMSNSQKTLALSFGVLAAGLGPHLVLLGKLTEGVGAFQSSIGKSLMSLMEFGNGSKESFNKAFESMGKVSEGFSNFMSGSSKLSSVLRTVRNDTNLLSQMLLSGLGEKLNPLTSRIGAFSNGIKNTMGKAFESLPQVIQGPLSKIGTLVTSTFGKLPSLVTGPLAAFGSKVTGSLTSLMGVAMKLFLPATIVAALIVGLGAAYEQFGSQIDQMIQMVMQKGPTIVTNLAKGITAKIPYLVGVGASLLVSIINAIDANLPALAKGATDILTSLVNSLSNNMDFLIPSGLELIQTLATAIITNLPSIIESGLKLILSLVQGMSNNMDKVVATIVNLVMLLVNTIAQHLPQIIDVAIKIIVALIEGLAKALPLLVSYIPTIISGIIKAFAGVDWGSIGDNIIKGIIAGIKAAGSGILNTLKAICGDAFDGIKSFLGIHSPSKKAHDEIGIQIGAGISTGITDSAPMLMKATAGYVDVLNKSFSDQLTTTVDVINNKAIDISDALRKAVTPEINFGTQIQNALGKSETYDSAIDKLKHSNEMLSVSTENAQVDLRNMLGEMTNLSTIASIADKQYLQLGNSIGWSNDKTQAALKEYQDAQKAYLDLGQKARSLQQSIIDNQYSNAYETMDSKIKELSTDTRDNIENMFNQQQVLQILKDKANILNTQLQEVTNSYGEFSDQVKSVKKDIDDNNQAILEMNNTLDDTQQKIQSTSVDSLNNLFDKLKSSLKDYYEDLEKRQEDSVQSQIDANDKWKDNALDNLEKVYNAKKDELDKEKSNLDRSFDDEDDANKEAELKRELDMHYGADKKKELTDELNDLIKQRNRRHQKEQLEDQSEALEKQYSTDKDSIETIAKNNEEGYNNQLQAIKSFYADKEKEANLDAEAQKLIVSNNQNEMVTLLKSYGEDYELAGNSLGERLIAGFKNQMYSLEEIFEGIALQAKDIMEKTSGIDTPFIDLSSVGANNGHTTAANTTGSSPNSSAVIKTTHVTNIIMDGKTVASVTTPFSDEISAKKLSQIKRGLSV